MIRKWFMPGVLYRLALSVPYGPFKPNDLVLCVSRREDQAQFLSRMGPVQLNDLFLSMFWPVNDCF